MWLVWFSFCCITLTMRRRGLQQELEVLWLRTGCEHLQERRIFIVLRGGEHWSGRGHIGGVMSLRLRVATVAGS